MKNYSSSGNSNSINFAPGAPYIKNKLIVKSRLSGGLVVDIGSPDYDLKLDILKKKILDYQNSFKEKDP